MWRRYLTSPYSVLFHQRSNSASSGNCKRTRLSQSWISRLVARYHGEGDAAFDRHIRVINQYTGALLRERSPARRWWAALSARPECLVLGRHDEYGRLYVFPRIRR